MLNNCADKIVSRPVNGAGAVSSPLLKIASKRVARQNEKQVKLWSCLPPVRCDEVRAEIEQRIGQEQPRRVGLRWAEFCGAGVGAYQCIKTQPTSNDSLAPPLFRR